MILTVITEKSAINIIELVPSIRWSGDLHQAARTLEYSILCSATDETVPVVDCPLGASVQLIINEELLFSGVIVSRSKSTDSSLMDITCFDRAFYLMRNKTMEQYKNKTPEAITKELAGKFGFQIGNIASTDITLSRLFLSGNDSVFDIISTVYTLASQQNGKAYHIGFLGDNLYVAEKKQNDKTLIIQGGSNLMQASITESIDKMVNAVQIYDANNNLIKEKKKQSLIDLYGRMQEIVKQTKTDDGQIKAKSLLNDGAVSQKITIDSLGNIANITGGSAVVKEPHTGLYGLFYIDSDVHEWKLNQYYNKLVLNYKALMSEKEAGSLPNADGKKTATSTGNGAAQTTSSAQKTLADLKLPPE